MDYVGNNNIKLPLIGLGTYSIHGKHLENVLSEAISLGYTLFDTASKYGNEVDFKGVLQSEPDLIVQSKIHSSPLRGRLRYLHLDKKSVKKSFLLSSEKLSRPPDIYFLHSPFDGYEKSFQDLLTLREEGDLKAVGICNVCLEQLQALVKKVGGKPDVVQVEIHPYHNNRGLVEYCHEQEILVEARSPFAHGDALPEWMNNGELLKIASYYGKSVPQVVLRWIIQQEVIPIIRSIDSKHLKEDINIFDFELTPSDSNGIFSLNRNLSFGYISSK